MKVAIYHSNHDVRVVIAEDDYMWENRTFTHSREEALLMSARLLSAVLVSVVLSAALALPSAQAGFGRTGGDASRHRYGIVGKQLLGLVLVKIHGFIARGRGPDGARSGCVFWSKGKVDTIG